MFFSGRRLSCQVDRSDGLEVSCKPGAQGPRLAQESVPGECRDPLGHARRIPVPLGRSVSQGRLPGRTRQCLGSAITALDAPDFMWDTSPTKWLTRVNATLTAVNVLKMRRKAARKRRERVS